MDFLKGANAVYAAEIVTVLAILTVLGYYLYSIGVFKKK
ncbi:MAG: hypothetical protein BWZ08_02021 [candidate division BRC1 bacterium ADurb.BinA292]|nr:MAG: hypothetical protein BWZ08_02021 [candidate division BRC1 bacterium ADurb.BinA292]